MATVISVRDLYKRYTTYHRGETFGETVKSLFVREKSIISAVNGISFDIAEAEIVGLLGPNGAGKSTTIKMLTGVLFPSAGEINVLGFVPFRDRKRYVSHIGAVFGQKSQLIWDIPPLDSFRLNKAIYGIPDEVYNAQLDKMVDLLDLHSVITRPTRVLSLGERMKCEFIMSMLHKPKVVFLDEPTIGVDLIARASIHEFIREMNREGVTFILTTHNLDDVERLAHRVIIINHGEKVFEDTLPVLRQYLGDKKTVRIITKSPIPDLGNAFGVGVTLIEALGETEVVVEIDHALLPMNDFMGGLAALGALQDISIKEIDVDTVIKTIYEQ